MIKFPDVFLGVIYDYLKKHDGDIILYKDLIDKYKMSYTTVRKKIKWLEEHGYIEKNKRRIKIIPQW